MIGGMKNVWCKIAARANLYWKTEYQKSKRSSDHEHKSKTNIEKILSEVYVK